MSEVRWLDDREQLVWRGFLSMQSRLFSRLERQLQRETGLSGADYAVLVSLSDSPDGSLRPFELGAEVDWEKSRLSHHLRRMADRGLVKRHTCDTDGRGAVILITDAGREAIEKAAPYHVEEVRRWFIDLLTPEQLQTLAQISQTVIERLAAEDPGP
ncbi:MarR family winged helix-turn-helix transcriptional regulator [Planotetraspora sp. GP83]|uniref:MarR family winged helix-turn-helix transcriptional regulator n=1 Tax=Planotetraspora sp. GP83 TaxID=3156264 RepID=UPI003511C944